MVTSDDEYISTATTTGLIESIVINAENLDKSYSLFNEILEYCGSSTRKYIKEWSAFQGIELHPRVKFRGTGDRFLYKFTGKW